MSDNKRKCIGT